jgi:prepilin-type N-terminal cleavage/methylation domain-containing protein
MAVTLLKHTAKMLRIARASTPGFTLVEVLLVVAVVVIVAGMGVPLMANIGESMKLGEAAREVERELQTARMTAVSANQPMRLRFDCPVVGAYRIVELVGTPSAPAAADSIATRCLQTSYPYPPDSDKNPLTRPNHDGPVRYLASKVTFTASTTIEFWPDGTAHTNTGGVNPWPGIAGTGTTITLTKGTLTKSIKVNGVGKVQIQ